MSEFDALLDLIPTDDIAKKLGIPESVADAAVKQVLPGLVSGLAANASTKEGQASLEKAVAKHATKPTLTGTSASARGTVGAKATGSVAKGAAKGSVKGGKASLKNVDTKDGEKIVGHVFGSKTDQVAGALAANSAKSDVTGDIIKQILPIVAPIVLSFLAQKLMSGGSSTGTSGTAGSGGIGDVLGGLLSSKQGQDMIGGVLGGLLGGK